MSVANTLRDVKELLGPEGENWCQHSHGLTVDGRMLVSGHMESAVKWCVSGALERCCGGFDKIPYRTWQLLADLAGGSFVGFNDTHEWLEVLALLDEAIEKAEENE